MTYLERYLNGEHEAVWAELVSLGEGIEDADIYPDALAVTTEIVCRSKQNLETLIERLRTIDYRFMNPHPIAPAPTDPEMIATFEREVCSLPLIFRVWHEMIGMVDFGGSHPQLADSDSFVWGGYDDDPPPADYKAHSFDEEAWKRGEICYVPYSQPMQIGDFEMCTWFTKAQVLEIGESVLVCELCSGPHDDGSIDLEFEGFCIDGKITNDGAGEDSDITFVEYMRRCFEWAGFPGFYWYEQDDRIKGRYGTPPKKLIAELTDGLLPI